MEEREGRGGEGREGKGGEWRRGRGGREGRGGESIIRTYVIDVQQKLVLVPHTHTRTDVMDR